MPKNKKKSKSDKMLEGLLKDALTKNMINSADEKFRELTEHCHRSLTVFRRIPYQMVDMGDKFLFVEINGFFGDVPDEIDLNAVYNFDALKDKKTWHKKKFSIDKCDITDVEIGGKFCGYFDRLCGYITISYTRGARLKKITFYMPGQNNQFAVKKFLGNIDVNINPSDYYPKEGKGRFLDKGEETIVGALVKFFNKKGMTINIVNWILSAASFLLIFFNSVLDTGYKYTMLGVAALLPLIIYLNYIKYNGIIRLLWSGGKTKTVYHKTRAECFIKIMLPTICLFLADTNNFGTMIFFKNYFILGFIFSNILMCLFDFCVPRDGSNYLKRGLVCGAMCLFYVFTSISHVNRIYTTRISSEVLNYPDILGYKSDSVGGLSYYCKVIMIQDECNFRISEEEYEQLENHELSTQVDLYSGILGLKYYDFKLVEASEEARLHSAYIESLPKFPPSSTHEDMHSYSQSILDALNGIVRSDEKHSELVSSTDME